MMADADQNLKGVGHFVAIMLQTCNLRVVQKWVGNIMTVNTYNFKVFYVGFVRVTNFFYFIIPFSFAGI